MDDAPAGRASEALPLLLFERSIETGAGSRHQQTDGPAVSGKPCLCASHSRRQALNGMNAPASAPANLDQEPMHCMEPKS